MIRNKHIDKICIFALLIAIITAGIFGSQRLSEKTTAKQGYEALLFDTSRVHSISIEMTDWDDFIKNAAAKQYRNCTITIDGERFENIAIRTKGGSSLEDVSTQENGKYSLKIEFDHNDKGVTYHGLDKLSLNNMIFDKTYMKDYVTYQMMTKAGVVSPLTSYSYVTVNGQEYGLYLNIEGIEDSFLRRNYGLSSGALYKPEEGGNEKDNEESTDNDGNSETGTYEDIDFENIDWDSLSEEELKEYEDLWMEGDEAAGDAVCLKYIDDKIESYHDIFSTAKTKVKKSDKKRLIRSLQILSSRKAGDAVDAEKVINYFVVHNFVSNDDGYTSKNVHNYYLYEQNGKLSMIPWDYNLAFGTMGEHNESEVINQSMDTLLTDEEVSARPMFGWIVNDEKYKELYHQYYQQFITTQIDSGDVDKLIDETAALLRPYIEKDPKKFYTADTFDDAVSALKKYVELRTLKIKNELSGSDAGVNVTGFRFTDLGTEDS